MSADNAKRRRANGSKIACAFSLKQPKQRVRYQQKSHGARRHDDYGKPERYLYRVVDAPPEASAVIIAHNGNQSVAQAKHRHEYKGLQFEIDAQHAHRDIAVGHQNQVHQHVHHRGDGLHDDAGKAHRENALDNRAVRAETFPAQHKLLVFGLVEDKAKRHAADLPDNRRNRRAGHAHAGHAQKAKNQDRVQHDVNNRANELRGHGKHGVARCLHHTLKGYRQKQAEAKHAHKGQVFARHFLQRRLRRKQAKEAPGCKKADQKKQQIPAQFQQHAVFRCGARFLRPFFAKLPADQAVDAHAQARRHRDHQHLHREGERHRRKRVGAVARHKNAIHHVIKRLHQHAHHNRHRHLCYQLAHLHGAKHFGPFLLLHTVLLLYRARCSLNPAGYPANLLMIAAKQLCVKYLEHLCFRRKVEGMPSPIVITAKGAGWQMPSGSFEAHCSRLTALHCPK